MGAVHAVAGEAADPVTMDPASTLTPEPEHDEGTLVRKWELTRTRVMFRQPTQLNTKLSFRPRPNAPATRRGMPSALELLRPQLFRGVVITPYSGQPGGQVTTDADSIKRATTPAFNITKSTPLAVPVLGDRLRSALEHLQRLSRLEAGWDSYGASPLDQRALDAARRTILDLFGRLANKAVPEAARPLSTGGIQLDFEGAHGQLEVEVSPSGDLRALLVQEQDDRQTFEQIADPSIERISELLDTIAVADE